MAANDNDRFDQWLDSALKEYGNAEPRAGLEGRIMANLEPRSRSFVRRGWTFAIASIAACAVFFTVSRIESPRPTPIDLVPVPSSISESVVQMSNANSFPSAKRTALPKVRRRTRSAARLSATRRLDHFPSPRPLTDRELALAKYAQNFPKEAGLIAQEQQTFEEEMQREQSELRKESGLTAEER